MLCTQRYLLAILVVFVLSLPRQNDAKHQMNQLILGRQKVQGFINIEGVLKYMTSVMTSAIRQSLFEQEVEDRNAVHKMDSHLVRRLIVMPLTEQFRPNQADPMHSKVQYGDKCSLPISLGRLIFDERYEVPWLFEISAVTKDGIMKHNQREIPANTDINTKPLPSLEKAYISPLDFRAPENYIFLPRWVMKELGLHINDLVDVSFVRMKLASLVVLQPLTLEWEDLVKDQSDPKSLLEHELNKYSSLTAGSTIAISIKSKEYSFYVKDTFAEGGIKVHGVRIQDADVHTDIDRSILDNMLAERKENESQ